MPDRPKNEEELQRLEAIGVIRASRFVRKFAHEHKKPSMDTVIDIHRHIFNDAWPEISGQMRTVPLKITDSKHLPPHHSQVHGLMKEAREDLDRRIAGLHSIESYWLEERALSDEQFAVVDRIVGVAAWLHHKITFVHPFQDGLIERLSGVPMFFDKSSHFV